MAKREIWKNVMGFSGRYQVSSLGRLRSLSRIVKRSNGISRRVPPKILAQCAHSRGYLLVSLSKGGFDSHKTVHRVVAAAFHKNPRRKKFVNHLDGDKRNNHSTNLRWVTASENMLHSYRIGLHK